MAKKAPKQRNRVGPQTNHTRRRPQIATRRVKTRNALKGPSSKDSRQVSVIGGDSSVVAGVSTALQRLGHLTLVKKAALLGFVCALLSVVAFAGYGSNSDPVVEPVYEQDAQPMRIEGKYLLTGTVVWDRKIEQWSKDEFGAIDPAHPFSGLDTFEPEKYDAWVADLECPTSFEDVPPELGETTLEFNCLQEYLPEAAKYFDFFNLANNHAGNSGEEKLEETREALAVSNIQYFGDPEPGSTDETCEIVGLPVRLVFELSGQETEEQQTLPVAFCAWHYFYRLPLPGEIDVMKEYAEVMPVFAYLHMGAEYKPQADRFQQDVARSIVDAGADFVIANNPHWVQDSEVYKDKLIVYSTGNFIFDQLRDEELSRSVSIDTEISTDYSLDLSQWLKLGQSCSKYKDSCLERAREQGLERINLDYTFAPVAGDISSQVNVRADESIQRSVEERLNWSEVSSALGQ